MRGADSERFLNAVCGGVMNKLKLSLFLIAALLIGCTNTSDEGNGSEGDIVEPDPVGSSSSSSGGISNTALPISENFGTYTNFDQADAFNFFGAYRGLETDVDNPDYVDPHPSFYYPTSGLYDSNGVAGGVAAVDAANRLWIVDGGGGNPALRLNNARFTIGQTLSETLANPTATDKKINSTAGNATIDTGSWGELNLSNPYKISFCVKQASSGGNFEIYVDNNSGGTAANSIHVAASRIAQVAATTLTAGQRHAFTSSVGDDHSFLQFRCDSGCSGFIIDDLWIGRQNATGTEPVSCNLPTPATPTGLALDAGDESIDVSWDASAFAASYDVAYNIANDPDEADGATVVNVAGTSTTLTGLVNDTEYFVFVRAKNANGDASAYSASQSATPEEPLAPPGVPTGLSLNPGDQEIDVSWDATPTATEYDVAHNTIDDPDIADGATVIADIATTSTTITGLTNGTPYFVFVRAKNAAGSSAYSASQTATPTAATTTALPYTENFNGPVLTDGPGSGGSPNTNFFTTAYKTIFDDITKPLNVITGGSANISIANTATDGTLSLFNARFTIGDQDPGTPTAAATSHLGDFNLDPDYRITFTVLTNANAAGNCQVYVDNNTTASGSSIHSTIGSTASRIFQKSAATLSDANTPTGTVTINSSVGTTTSFLQFRCDSGVTSPVVIDNILIQYQ
jgi:hypothetical protein